MPVQETKDRARHAMFIAGHDMLPWYEVGHNLWPSYRANCYRCHGFVRVYHDGATWVTEVHSPMPCTEGR